VVYSAGVSISIDALIELVSIQRRSQSAVTLDLAQHVVREPLMSG